MYDFKPGDEVFFIFDSGYVRKGNVIRVNKKSITIKPMFSMYGTGGFLEEKVYVKPFKVVPSNIPFTVAMYFPPKGGPRGVHYPTSGMYPDKDTIGGRNWVSGAPPPVKE